MVQGFADRNCGHVQALEGVTTHTCPPACTPLASLVDVPFSPPGLSEALSLRKWKTWVLSSLPVLEGREIETRIPSLCNSEYLLLATP